MTFKIHTEYIQLNQLIKSLKISQSGGQAKLFIENGEVKVNSETEFRVRAKIYPGDEVEVFDLKVLVEKQ